MPWTQISTRESLFLLFCPSPGSFRVEYARKGLAVLTIRAVQDHVHPPVRCVSSSTEKRRKSSLTSFSQQDTSSSRRTRSPCCTTGRQTPSVASNRSSRFRLLRRRFLTHCSSSSGFPTVSLYAFLRPRSLELTSLSSTGYLPCIGRVRPSAPHRRQQLGKLSFSPCLLQSTYPSPTDPRDALLRRNHRRPRRRSLNHVSHV
jgi:hypothetical protein